LEWLTSANSRKERSDVAGALLGLKPTTPSINLAQKKRTNSFSNQFSEEGPRKEIAAAVK